MENKKGKLYIVATPIGNLGDISARAIETLKSVDMVLCEDTRNTKKLLSHFDINTPTMSYHAYSKLTKIEKIIELLKDGKDLALVSDAGTPAISDPGSFLIKNIRDEFEDSLSIIPISGPSALISFLSVSGLNSDKFTFFGFLPHKKGRETIFKEITESQKTSVFYESPHRILKTLKSLADFLYEDRIVVLGRELTKIHEQVIYGSAEGVLNYFVENEDKIRGEFVVGVSGRK